MVASGQRVRLATETASKWLDSHYAEDLLYLSREQHASTPARPRDPSSPGKQHPEENASHFSPDASLPSLKPISSIYRKQFSRLVGRLPSLQASKQPVKVRKHPASSSSIEGRPPDQNPKQDAFIHSIFHSQAREAAIKQVQLTNTRPLTHTTSSFNRGKTYCIYQDRPYSFPPARQSSSCG
jgi:hypothetical protein